MKTGREKIYMRAYATASGGVVFVPDTLKRKTISYASLVKGEVREKPAQQKRGFLFGWRPGSAKKAARQAVA